MTTNRTLSNNLSTWYPLDVYNKQFNFFLEHFGTTVNLYNFTDIRQSLQIYVKNYIGSF